MNTVKEKTMLAIIEWIDFSELGYDEAIPTDKLGQIKFGYKEFKKTHQWNIDRVGELKALEEYFQGLPSWFNCPFSYYEINKFLVENEIVEAEQTDTQFYKSIDQYWQKLAFNFLQLVRGNNLPKSIKQLLNEGV